MTIGQLSAETEIPASAIRYYERIGILPAPSRVSGQRRYGPDAATRLAVVRLAQSCGFQLEEIRTLVYGFSSGTKPSIRWKKLAEQKVKEIDQQMEKLSAMRQMVDQVLKCHCIDLAECGRTGCSELVELK